MFIAHCNLSEICSNKIKEVADKFTDLNFKKFICLENEEKMYNKLKHLFKSNALLYLKQYYSIKYGLIF